MIAEKFVVGGVTYRCFFEANQFYFGVVSSETKNMNTVILDELSFFDDPPEIVIHSDYAPKTDTPILVYRNVFDFVGRVIKQKKPYYFYYTINEPRKIGLYLKAAERLCAKFGYILEELDNKFMFYRAG